MNDPARRARLEATKLAALVREHVGGDPELHPGEFAAGAALLHDGAAWVLLDDAPAGGMGGALAWSVRQQARSVHLVVETGSGGLARRAAGFSIPITVWRVQGRTLLRVDAEPLPAPSPLPDEHRAMIATIVAGGADPVVEHGVLTGEVDGLEVCRVVTDAATGEVRLEIGVGAHDRETFQLLHGERPTIEALAGVVSVVAAQRRPGAEGHPLNRLAQARALRARLIAEPVLIEATEVVAAEPPVARRNVKDPAPCVATAVRGGTATVVVCSVGVDLEVVPYAVDARTALRCDPCIVVVPRRDHLDIQRRIGELASPPITFVPVDSALA